MAFCSENEPNSVSSLCAGNKKLHSRQEVKSVQGFTRVDAKPAGVSTDLTDLVELPLHVVATILECCVTFSGVKLSIRSFVLSKCMG